MAWADLPREEQALMHQAMRSSKFMDIWLAELQSAALGSLIAHPELVGEATAHLFDAGHRVYVEIFRALRSGKTDLVALYDAAHSRLPNTKNIAGVIASLSDFPASDITARHNLNVLKKFVRWQYDRARQAQRRTA